MDPIRETRAFLAGRSPADLVCDDFTDGDIDLWATTPWERHGLRKVLDLVARGDADYLAVRSPNGVPVSKCGVNYVEKPMVGVIMQFDTRDGLRSLGLGRRLLTEAEHRIVSRGVVTAELGSPEDSFPHYIGAALFRRSAFERLGRFDPGMRFGEDSDWFVRARQHEVKVAHVDRTTLLVRRHGGNMTEGKSLVELNMLTIIKKAIDRKRVMQGVGEAETHG